MIIIASSVEISESIENCLNTINDD
jgi:hypothetical protein